MSEMITVLDEGAEVPLDPGLAVFYGLVRDIGNGSLVVWMSRDEHRPLGFPLLMEQLARAAEQEAEQCPREQRYREEGAVTVITIRPDAKGSGDGV